MKFKVLNKNIFSFNNYEILPFRDEDKLKIKEWRNLQMDVLRQKKLLTDSDQINYFNNYVLPTFEQEAPKIMLFSFLEDKTCIGYGGLTNIDWESKHIEMSFLIDPQRLQPGTYKKDFSAFITLIKMVVFEELKFNRIFTETYDIRPLHISILEKNGFKLEGRMVEHILINGKFTDLLIHSFLKKDYYA
ncbi:MAG: GNAT family N-acetyltransferase [Bacteroidota bacterium]